MAKNTNAKIKELKGVKAEKITDIQLEDLQSIVKDINRQHHEIGVQESKKHNMLHHMSEYQRVLVELQKEFKEDYGSIDVDILTGEIKYDDNGEADKKD